MTGRSARTRVCGRICERFREIGQENTHCITVAGRLAKAAGGVLIWGRCVGGIGAKWRKVARDFMCCLDLSAVNACG